MAIHVMFNDDHPVVLQAVQEANQLFNGRELYQHIRRKESFDPRYTNVSPFIIADLLQNSKLMFNVELFYPSGLISHWKYRKTLGYKDHAFPNTLFLNVKKLDRPIHEITATIIHECVHALDEENQQYSFGHGDNSPKYKGETAPYWIGNEAIRILKGNQAHVGIEFDVEE